jgi:hypothetical protein
VTGAASAAVTKEGGAEVHLLTGESARLKCVLLDAKDKASAAALEKVRASQTDFEGAGLPYLTVRGEFEGLVTEKDEEGRPQRWVRLGRCRVVAASELALK